MQANIAAASNPRNPYFICCVRYESVTTNIKLAFIALVGLLIIAIIIAIVVIVVKKRQVPATIDTKRRISQSVEAECPYMEPNYFVSATTFRDNFRDDTDSNARNSAYKKKKKSSKWRQSKKSDYNRQLRSIDDDNDIKSNADAEIGHRPSSIGHPVHRRIMRQSEARTDGFDFNPGLPLEDTAIDGGTGRSLFHYADGDEVERRNRRVANGDRVRSLFPVSDGRTLSTFSASAAGSAEAAIGSLVEPARRVIACDSVGELPTVPSVSLMPDRPVISSNTSQSIHPYGTQLYENVYRSVLRRVNESNDFEGTILPARDAPGSASSSTIDVPQNRVKSLYPPPMNI
jgi:hypothetical protein